jgi:hypothetical protein
MDVVERGVISLGGPNKLCNIPLTSFTSHLNGKTQFKKIGSLGIVSKEKNTIILQESEITQI